MANVSSTKKMSLLWQNGWWEVYDEVKMLFRTRGESTVGAMIAEGLLSPGERVDVDSITWEIRIIPASGDKALAKLNGECECTCTQVSGIRLGMGAHFSGCPAEKR